MGTPGDDVIVGLGGSDVVKGRGGDDRVCGGPGDDTLLGGGGTDVLDGGNGDDALHGGRDGWWARGPGDRALLGDVLEPGPGNDLVDGGQDARQRWKPTATFDPEQPSYPDSVDLSSSPEAVEVRLAGAGGRGRARGQGADTIVGQPVLAVVGTAYDDRIVGGPASDVLSGGGGADVLDGRAGRDVLDDVDPQDPEEERWAPSTEVDRLRGGPGADVVMSTWGSDRVRAGGGADLVDMNVGACGRLDGGTGADRLGMRANQRGVAELDIAAGTISGGLDGAPCTVISAFEKYLPTGYTTFVVRGTDSVDRIGVGPPSPRWIWSATDGHTRLVASLRGGNDVVVGSGGDDLIDAGPGADRVRAGGGTDVCLGAEDAAGCEQDSLPGGTPTCDGRTATILAEVAGGRVVGTPQDDVIVGSSVNDRIDGLGGDDTICAGDGADVLRGGSGQDRLFGGPDGVLRYDNDPSRTVLSAIGDAVLPGPGDDLVDLGLDPRQHQGDPGNYDQLEYLPDVLDYSDSPVGVVADLTTTSDVVAVHVGPESDSAVFPPGTMLRASLHADVITGSPGDDVVAGLGGGDVVTGGAGNDSLDGEVSCGWYDACAAADLVPDDLDGGDGVDRLMTRWRAGSSVRGGAGDDWLTVLMDAPGDSHLDGGDGHDTVDLEAALPGRTWHGTVDLGVGTFTYDRRPSGVLGHVASFEELRLDRDDTWTVFGSSGADAIWGAGEVWSRGGDDFVSGTFGDDFIDTGDGHDEVWAYDGQDTCLHAEVTSSCEVKKAD
ncbi:hypothetical protein ISU07_14495 [Nocardioides islandensis]|uniref:Calcium-binding protein n=1 Tax=Nocardioides islandensis TaxID=433663 RepID=A0A930YL73_9ACTN|nr:hypothetical protein [Nocardioides islandensis]